VARAPMRSSSGPKRVLLVHPDLNPPGGGNGVAARTIQSLREAHDVTLVAWVPPHLRGVNEFFGTSLRASDFRLRLIPWPLRLAVDRLPVRGALLRNSVMARWARWLLARQSFDVAMTTQNEMNFGRRGIQYVHYPEGLWPRDDGELLPVHRAHPRAVAWYRRLSVGIGGATKDGVSRNLTLVNSNWTGERFRALYGGTTRTVYPPVDAVAPEVAFDERSDEFVCIGRFVEGKRLETVIEIIARVRERHPSVRLHIVGSPTEPLSYSDAFVARASKLGAWLTLHQDLPRRDLMKLVSRCRFGIHGMPEEHFGMAVAEMQRTGAVVFVPRGGGQVEIVGSDERLVYDGVADAVAKIDAIVTDEPLRRSVLAAVAARRGLFVAERFEAEICGIVDGFTALDGGELHVPERSNGEGSRSTWR
jgi:glycosyltransferase involved in cell wall biosynthesis